MHIIRQRQQKKTAEENAVYFAILQKALPQEPSRTTDDNDRDSKNGAEDSGAIVVTSSTVTVQSDRDARPKVSPKTNHGGGGGGGKTSNRERVGSSSGGRHGKSGNTRTTDRSNSCKSQSQPANSDQQQQATGHGTGTAAVANGDVPRPSSAGKVHVVGGKKQLAVKAVPRSNNSQPPQTSGATPTGTTSQDTVKDKVGCKGLND